MKTTMTMTEANGEQTVIVLNMGLADAIEVMTWGECGDRNADDVWWALDGMERYDEDAACDAGFGDSWALDVDWDSYHLGVL